MNDFLSLRPTRHSEASPPYSSPIGLGDRTDSFVDLNLMLNRAWIEPLCTTISSIVQATSHFRKREGLLKKDLPIQQLFNTLRVIKKGQIESLDYYPIWKQSEWERRNLTNHLEEHSERLACFFEKFKIYDCHGEETAMAVRFCWLKNKDAIKSSFIQLLSKQATESFEFTDSNFNEQIKEVNSNFSHFVKLMNDNLEKNERWTDVLAKINLMLPSIKSFLEEFIPSADSVAGSDSDSCYDSDSEIASAASASAPDGDESKESSENEISKASAAIAPIEDVEDSEEYSRNDISNADILKLLTFKSPGLKTKSLLKKASDQSKTPASRHVRFQMPGSLPGSFDIIELQSLDEILKEIELQSLEETKKEETKKPKLIVWG